MNNWGECLNSFSARKRTSDKPKAKSLIEIAHARIEQTSKNVNEKSANFIFEDYYTSILELLQAIVQLNGYDVNNHICLGYFIRDVLKKEQLFNLFDDLRFKRNSLIYYGKRMDFEIAKLALEKSRVLFFELNKILKELK